LQVGAANSDRILNPLNSGRPIASRAHQLGYWVAGNQLEKSGETQYFKSRFTFRKFNGYLTFFQNIALYILKRTAVQRWIRISWF